MSFILEKNHLPGAVASTITAKESCSAMPQPTSLHWMALRLFESR